MSRTCFGGAVYRLHDLMPGARHFCTSCFSADSSSSAWNFACNASKSHVTTSMSSSCSRMSCTQTLLQP